MRNALVAQEPQDPVCGMRVTLLDGPHYVYQAQDYFFCCTGCLHKFEQDPEFYLSNVSQPDEEYGRGMTYVCPKHPKVREPCPGECPKCSMELEVVVFGAMTAHYICPMHSEVQQQESGHCPICGMGLESTLAMADKYEAELQSMTRRFWVSVVLCLPLLVLSMHEMIAFIDIEDWIAPRLNAIIQAGLSTPIVLWAAAPFFVRAYKSFVTLKLNMWSLIGLGTGVTYLVSVLALFLPNYLPEALWVQGAMPMNFEVAGVIITLVLLGQVLELRVRGRAAKALKSLLALVPPVALRIKENLEVEQILVDEVQVGDHLRVNPEQRVPVDGMILTGDSSVDNSFISGESMPVSVTPSDVVIGGALNQNGSFVMRADKVGSDALLSRITILVAEASHSRAPIQSLADKVASIFVPIVLLSALIAFAVWTHWGPEPSMSNGLLVMISVMIIASPYAVGLSTPMSIVMAAGRGAQQGVLVRDARSMEMLNEVDTLVLDKTGSLTEGKPRLQEFNYLEGIDEHELATLIYSLECLSEHPLAQAVVQWGKERDLGALPVTEFEAQLGKGVSGNIDGHLIYVGNKRFLSEQGLTIEIFQAAAEACRTKAQTVMFVAVDGVVLGFISVSDPIKASSFNAISALQKKGLRIIMLTGDNRATAEAVAAQLNIAEVVPEVLPQDKFRLVKRLQEKGLRVAMVGNGINDAPALAQADVGIAMGTDVTMATGDLVLVGAELTGLLRAMKLSEATMHNIKQNLFFAFVYNVLAVPIAAGVLYPSLGILLNPMYASVAMSFSSLAVIANALRLRILDTST